MRDCKDSLLGFQIYQKFYEISYKTSQKTFDQFINSHFYSQFVAFGKYLIDTNPIEPEGFVTFLIKNGYKINDWQNDATYIEWIKELGRKESPFRAFERNILLMQKWGQDHNEAWYDFFRKINPQLATQWIRTGRLSPWMLYSESGDALLSRLSDEQLDLVHELINPIFWTQKLLSNKEEIKQINSLLKEYKI